MATPRLITPKGKTIELSQETYKQIRKLLREGSHPVSKARRRAAIRATYGKYAGKASLTQALLKERKKELAREEAKLKRRNG
jgi:hypothetical protein